MWDRARTHHFYAVILLEKGELQSVSILDSLASRLVGNFLKGLDGDKA
jgi:hypothetical protein